MSSNLNIIKLTPTKEPRPKFGIEKYIEDGSSSDNETERLDDLDDEFEMLNDEDKSIINKCMLIDP